MIDALIQGRIHGTPTERTGKSGKPFALAKVRTEGGISGGALWLAWSWLVARLVLTSICLFLCLFVSLFHMDSVGPVGAWLVLASKPSPCVGLLAIHCPTLAVQWSHALAQFCAIVPMPYWCMAGAEKPPTALLSAMRLI